MWKHKESKWLVRGGRKVKCYLCGKKILAKGDLFLFHGDTGYYSHQSCQVESTTISGNERRRAVKKIAVGAAVVGAIAAGAGKFLDVSSQSKNSPAAQTILTSQGLIPPALTSDPANPVPGQMWYRSDAGVMAHFDGVQNRVVYSSEINDGNVNVTSKGIINGLSVLPNDGKGGFGPDTTLGATAPGQYGSPYTETSGIQESTDYGRINNRKIYQLAGVYHFTGPNPSPSLGSNFVFVTVPSTGTYVIDIEGESPSMTNNNLGVVWDMTSLPSPSTNNSWYAFGFASATSNTSGSLVLKNIQFNTPKNVGFVYGDSCYASKYEFLFGYAASVSTLSNCVGFAVDGYLSNINWSNTLYAENVWNGYLVTHSHLTASTLNAFNCQIAFAVTIGDDYNTLGSVIEKLNTVNCGTVISSVATSTSSAKIHIFSVNDFTSPYNSPITISTDIIDSGNYLTAEIDVWNHVNQETSSSSYNWLAPTFDGGMYVHVNQIFGTTGFIVPSVSISTNPPVSGTAQQNTNPFDIRLKIPVTYSPTSSAAATLATGTSSSSTVTTSTKVSYPAGITTGIIETYEMVVKAGQYFELVVTNATIGTVEVQAVS